MKLHLIIAHPDKNAFNFALHQTALDVFKQQNLDTVESNLYGDNFSPTASYRDVENIPESEAINLAKAQR